MLMLNKFLRDKELKFILIALVLPVILALIWFYHNNQLPSADATGYLDAAFAMYKKFLHGKYGSAIASLYADRSWRPVSFQLIIVPFLLIFKGNIYLASCATT